MKFSTKVDVYFHEEYKFLELASSLYIGTALFLNLKLYIRYWDFFSDQIINSYINDANIRKFDL